MSTAAMFFFGVALSSCLPGVLAQATGGNPALLLGGGICAVLPDLLERALRHRRRHVDITIAPDPQSPNAHAIATGLADGIAVAIQWDRPIHMCIRPTQTGPDTWLALDACLMKRNDTITVTFHGGGTTAVANIPSPVSIARGTTVTSREPHSLFFKISPQADGSVVVDDDNAFAACAHAITPAILIALGASILFTPTAGVIILSAWTAHLLIDQAGEDGCCWMAPFSSAAVPGFRWLRGSATMRDLVLTLVSTTTLLTRLL
ncbi:MAG: hypothetical protein OSB41_00775 [Kiritimatiellae bacterium]|nr:hypothetical protein [Kiritimatiellia bacterium]